MAETDRHERQRFFSSKKTCSSHFSIVLKSLLDDVT